MLKIHQDISPSASRAVSDASVNSRNCGVIARRAATQLAKNRLSSQQRLDLCLSLLGGAPSPALSPLADALTQLHPDERHYWIGTFYTLLMSQEQRKRQSAYFTPPEIAHHLLRLTISGGAGLETAHVLDPAAGGAAFLSMVAGRMKDLGCKTDDILQRVRGIELDPMLAELARRLIAERLGVRSVPKHVVTVGDALTADFRKRFDLVLANPPYGRIFPADLISEDWRAICHPGHINKYALFVDLCLSRVKAGGIVGLVIPSSFIAGPLYCRLREVMRDKSLIKVLGQVQCRDEFFFDVTQDTSLLILQRRLSTPARTQRQGSVTFGRIDKSGKWTAALPLALPTRQTDGWLLPGNRGASRGGATLTEYGCNVKTGYFVWNREQDRMTKRRGRRAVPLFWACNIRPNISAQPRAKDGSGTDYVRFDGESTAILSGPSILLQRTTNTKQPRRLVAALVDTEPYLSKGYVSENHTIVITARERRADLGLVCKLLNSAAVDQRYRQLSGTASISTLLLRELDLPTPANLIQACARHPDFETAVEVAYSMSARAQRKSAL